jgi:hypothetical protein
MREVEIASLLVNLRIRMIAPLVVCATSRSEVAMASERDHSLDRSSCKSIERFESCPVRSIRS